MLVLSFKTFNIVCREMENANGYVKFQNHYGRVHIQLSGNCKTWRSDLASEDGGWLSTDVFVDTLDQKWHANLNISNLFVPVRCKMDVMLNFFDCI